MWNPSAVLSFGSLALLICGLPSCGGQSSPHRIVVSPRAFEFASNSTEDIVKELTPGDALTVLKELGRVETDRSAENLPADKILYTYLPKGRSSDAIEVYIHDRVIPPPMAAADGDGDGRAAAEQVAATDGVRLPPHVSPNNALLLQSSNKKEVLRQGFYFSTVTAIAVEEGLDPIAIPALVLGYRPDLDDYEKVPGFIRQSGIGFDLLVGGALNTASGEGDDVELALGLGISIPWSDSGALSIGAVTWRGGSVDPVTMEASSETEVALYVGISLGGFNVGSKEQ